MSSTAAPSPRLQAQRSLTRMMVLLQALGAVSMLVVWVIERRAGVITEWDNLMLPLSAAVVGGTALAITLWPALEARLRAVPVATFNLFLVVTLHAALAHTSGNEQRYQVLSDLYWVPLGYGCAFVFLNLRTALVVSGFTAAGVFTPLLLLAMRGALPAWVDEGGPLLPQVVLSHALFIVLLTAVVRLRSHHDRAQAHAEIMRELAETDPLTGLPNRRAMGDRLHAAMALAQRTGQPLWVGLIDVDRFKSVNDRFGHAAGDAVLQQISRAMRAQLRASDVLGRWGGEEFLLLAPGTPAAAASTLAERVRESVAAQAFPHGEPVTISIGLTGCWPRDKPEALLQRADRALYRAKTGGRDRIETQLEEVLA